ncbi:MAG: hypothetical protein ACI8P9_001539 [Parasphingorhabdus sp.]|jgi:hypothetical protein
MTDQQQQFGGCLCGEVRYKICGQLRDVVICHCETCQKLHGGFGPHSKAAKPDIILIKSESLTWYKTSEVARRGFCSKCGSGLFWEPFEQDATGIVAGTLDTPTGLSVMGHIFVGEKSDFYTITDAAPQFNASSGGQLEGDSR